jgi:tyrosinase
VARTRREIYSLGQTWNDTVLWYAKAIKELRPRPITRKASWRYLAAMHDFDSQQWIDFRYLSASEALPPEPEQNVYWKQCQHGSWYFLPWHRAYLLSFEEIVGATVKALGGPDDWALPYWNYSSQSNASALNVPPAFLARTMPDGSDNPLFVTARSGRSLNPDYVRLDTQLSDGDFVGIDQGPHAGVGGPNTPFMDHGDTEGLIEAQPHDMVHGQLGGRGGLMAYTTMAALDPIFWLHHANIDRLWEVWRQRDPANKNPTDAAWLNGPSRKRRFAIFGPDEKDRAANPKDVLSTKDIGYTYDDTSDPLKGVTRRGRRLQDIQHRQPFGIAEQERPQAMPLGGKFELMGSNDKSLALGPETATARVKLASRAVKSLTGSFSATASHPDTPGEPDRVFLKLENITGKDGSGLFDVFVRGPGAGAGQDHTQVGSISLFGLERASARKGSHAGMGLTKTLEITKAVDALHQDKVNLNELEVSIVPRSEVRREDQIKVGQITLYRQSGQ